VPQLIELDSGETGAAEQAALRHDGVLPDTHLTEKRQKRRRPGTTCEGFQKALARVPMAALRLVAAAVRRRLLQVFGHRLVVDGFIPFGCAPPAIEFARCPDLTDNYRNLGAFGIAEGQFLPQRLD
jgi:hypothetical protein